MNIFPQLMAIMLIVATPALADQETLFCSEVRITRETDTAQDWKDICPALANGKEILSAMGLKLPATLQISFQRKPYTNDICQAKCVGYYDGSVNKLYLPGYKKEWHLQQDSGLFNGEISAGIWESYLIHELAHAAAKQMAATGIQLCVASEYIAAVAQIHALSEADRDAVLKQYNLGGFSGDRDITLTYYLIDPGRFAVNSYLHYRKLEDGPAYIRKILRNGLSCDN